jgi:hypothetical protein
MAVNVQSLEATVNAPARKLIEGDARLFREGFNRASFEFTRPPAV